MKYNWCKVYGLGHEVCSYAPMGGVITDESQIDVISVKIRRDRSSRATKLCIFIALKKENRPEAVIDNSFKFYEWIVQP